MTVARDTYVSATLARVGFDTLPRRSALRYPALADDDPAWRDARPHPALHRALCLSSARCGRARARTGKPVHLVDGEWTSWYGVRAIGGLAALAAFRRSLAPP